MTQEKDFLIDLAKIAESIEESGLATKQARLEFSVNQEEFSQILKLISKRIVLFGEQPKNELRLIISGVQVNFRVIQ